MNNGSRFKYIYIKFVYTGLHISKCFIMGPAGKSFCHKDLLNFCIAKTGPRSALLHPWSTKSMKPNPGYSKY